MKTKTTNLSLYREDADNVSTATDADIERLAGKLRRNPRGLVAMRIAYVTDDPPGSRTVNSGNKRLRVLKQIAANGGLAMDGAWLVSPSGDVPAEWFCDITFMTPEQRKEFRLNTNISDGSFDAEKLLAQYTRDDLAALMSAEAIDELCKQVEKDDPKSGQTDADSVPSTPETPVSKHGEVYICGEHRLMCGDSTKPNDVDKVCKADEADLWLTDPPYNVDYHGSDGQSIKNDSMEDTKFREFLRAAFGCAEKCLKSGGSFYIFHADSEGYNFRGACFDVGLRVRQCLVWKKNSLVLGRQDYKWIHEPCLYGWREGAAHDWYSDCSQTTVMEFNKPKKNDLHPTMKPVEMLCYLIGNSSKRGDIVLDTFCGSGSTLIACERTGRVCRCVELDPKYCDVIRRRWAEFVHGEGCDWQALTPKTK